MKTGTLIVAVLFASILVSCMDIILEPDTAEPKLGLMGVDSFYPYQADGKWYAFYGSSPEWNGLARSPSLLGPWKRISEAGVVSRHTENPVVSRLSNFYQIAGIWEAKSDSVFNGYFASIGMIRLKLVR